MVFQSISKNLLIKNIWSTENCQRHASIPFSTLLYILHFLPYLTVKLYWFYSSQNCLLIFGFLNQLQVTRLSAALWSNLPSIKRRSQINAPSIRIIRHVFEDYRKKLCNVRTYTPSRQFITILTQQKSETLELKTLYVLHDIN